MKKSQELVFRHLCSNCKDHKCILLILFEVLSYKFRRKALWNCHIGCCILAMFMHVILCYYDSIGYRKRLKSILQDHIRLLSDHLIYECSNRPKHRRNRAWLHISHSSTVYSFLVERTYTKILLQIVIPSARVALYRIRINTIYFLVQARAPYGWFWLLDRKMKIVVLSLEFDVKQLSVTVVSATK